MLILQMAMHKKTTVRIQTRSIKFSGYHIIIIFLSRVMSRFICSQSNHQTILISISVWTFQINKSKNRIPRLTFQRRKTESLMLSRIHWIEILTHTTNYNYWKRLFGQNHLSCLIQLQHGDNFRCHFYLNAFIANFNTCGAIV